MANPFFDQPILNTPYEMPSRYWELDRDGQPTQKIIPGRRIADFITPIPKPRKSKKARRASPSPQSRPKWISSVWPLYLRMARIMTRHTGLGRSEMP